jgi:CRP-like cAMP-binding protein
VTPLSLDKSDVLRQSEVFAGLPEIVLRNIAAYATVRRLARAEMLYAEGEDAWGLFVIASGEVRTVRQSVEGREQVLSTETRGAALALVPVFGGGPYFSSVIADTPSVVIGINRTDITRLCEKHPELLWNVSRVLARKVRYCAELIESLAFRNVDQRLVHHLLCLAEQHGVPYNGRGVTFELTSTRSEIASRLGSVREVVSRALSHLHEKKLIELRGRTVIIPDLPALRGFSGESAHVTRGRDLSHGQLTRNAAI